jgi:hypothetical protein
MMDEQLYISNDKTVKQMVNKKHMSLSSPYILAALRCIGTRNTSIGGLIWKGK